MNDTMSVIPESNDEREAWGVVKLAIEQAWAYTGEQVGLVGYDQRILVGSFGQLLFANICHFVHQLKGSHSSLVVKLCPNFRRTAYHLMVRIGSKTVTISGVPDQYSKPRHAYFRDDYASRQIHFIFEDFDDAKPVLKLPSDPPAHLILLGHEAMYYQILYGPHPREKRALGFILVARVNIYGEYIGASVDIDCYTGGMPYAPETGGIKQADDAVPVEQIKPEFEILPREDKCLEEQEVRDLREVD